ncbi:hypothetical protein SPI_03227 [Niveomyces insectorum RCEF 264]|uniref:Uncharacterized protein n=1 Tax=Niveomyces insectorum RCEF 264 TaxID=1081102 RepID=A0A162MNN4_9HYPO|nr:hypothetical protein SPI_03227 [Niveomyces insectorum RCEF 264]
MDGKVVGAPPAISAARAGPPHGRMAQDAPYWQLYSWWRLWRCHTGYPGSSQGARPRRRAPCLRVNLAGEINLSWTACYDGYECARLDVPMDWLDPTDEERVVLAVIRLSAVRRDDYRGAVFFNPGGPGGSGILSMRDHGKQLQTVVGDNHDIITFDPRGVGRSVPRIQCWEDYQRQHFWELQDVNNVNSYPGAAYDEFARAMAYSGICEA